MDLFGLTISRRKHADMVTRLPQPLTGWVGGVIGMVRESFAGAWQRNIEISTHDVMTHPTVWACVTLIAADISKLRIKLVEQDTDGIWHEIESPAFSPVLKKPNRYQTRIKFIENWISSKLTRGNTYILQERDGRDVVVGRHVLDPSRVQPLVASDGSVFYDLSTDHLAGVQEASVRVPASEIIHDVMFGLYHPLCGLSPIHACGLAATQGLKSMNQSAKFFENNSRPGGILTAPAKISNDTAQRIREHWNANYAGEENYGKVAILGDGIKYESMSVNAVDAQLIEQLKWGDEKICSVYHVPPYMVGVGPMPTYNNIEALNQQYYSQGLQNLIECIELLLDEGSEFGKSDETKRYGTEFDVEGGLLRMDSSTRVKAAGDAIKAGMSINEARKRYHDLGPTEGGETVYLQEQNWPLRLLNARQLPPDRPPTPAASLPEPDAETKDLHASELIAMVTKSLDAELRAM